MKFKIRRFDKTKEAFTVTTARSEIIAGIIFFVLFSGLLVWALVPGNDWSMNHFAYIVCGLLLAAVLFGIASAFSYRITVDGSKDSFVYRTSFFRTYEIKYSDCIYIKPPIRFRSRYYMIKTEKKRFFIERGAVNVKRLFVMMKANGVPSYDSFVSEKQPKDVLLKVTLEKKNALIATAGVLFLCLCIVFCLSEVFYYSLCFFIENEIEIKYFIRCIVLTLISIFIAFRCFAELIAPYHFSITVKHCMDGFVLVTAFNKAYNVLYKDCVSCKYSFFFDHYILKTKQKTFCLPADGSHNVERFLKLLSKNNVYVKK